MCHLHIGAKTAIAIVLSCPGRYEMIAGYPAAKTTGANLDKLLELLCEKLNRLDITRANITITNSWPHVEFLKLTGRSEPTKQEIIQPHNIARLSKELGNVTDFILLCGNRASLISNYLDIHFCPKFAHISHLGGRGLLSIQCDIQGKEIVAAETQIASGCKMNKRTIQHQNTNKRLEVVAQSIFEQLQNRSE